MTMLAKASILLSFCAVGAFSQKTPLQRHLEEAGGSEVPVIISFYDGKRYIEGVGGDYKRTVAVKASLNESEIERLMEEDPFVESIDLDGNVTLAAEVNSWEQFDASIIGTNSIPDPDPNDPPISVCLVDSGLMTDHEDFPYANSVIGTEFDLVNGATWDNPTFYGFHGTFMTNVIFAAQDGKGGVGVISNVTNNIRPMMCRPFNELSFASSSTVDKCVEWCANNGAKIINLSLGTTVWNRNSEKLTVRLWQEGILMVAASGNRDMEVPFYPAAFPRVIGVGSVKPDGERGWVKSDFSQYFPGLDLVSPGEDIYGSSIGQLVYDADGKNTEIKAFEASKVLREEITAELVDFGDGTSVPPASGKVCLIGFPTGLPTAWNATSISVLAQNCFLAGGVAAIVYEEQGASVDPLLTAPYTGKIPIYQVSFDEGQALKSSLGRSINIDPHTTSYRTYQGTSISAATVSGIAAKLWSVAPQCTNVQIREALEASAMSIGDDSENSKYGKGLVNADAAYAYLQSLPKPCGSAVQDGSEEPNEATDTVFLWSKKPNPFRASNTKNPFVLFDRPDLWSIFGDSGNRKRLVRRLRGSSA